MNRWYTTLKKAPWNPPNWVFGPIWTTLYALMIMSFLLIWTNKKCYPYCPALIYFLIQLFFNVIWTTIFFQYRAIRVALVDLVLTLVFVLFTFLEFKKINKLAGLLLVPYIAWLLVALSLNTYIVIYN